MIKLALIFLIMAAAALALGLYTEGLLQRRKRHE